MTFIAYVPVYNDDPIQITQAIIVDNITTIDGVPFVNYGKSCLNPGAILAYCGEADGYLKTLCDIFKHEDIDYLRPTELMVRADKYKYYCELLDIPAVGEDDAGLIGTEYCVFQFRRSNGVLKVSALERDLPAFFGSGWQIMMDAFMANSMVIKGDGCRVLTVDGLCKFIKDVTALGKVKIDPRFELRKQIIEQDEICAHR